MSKWPSVGMKFFRENGKPAMKANSGSCFSSKPKVLRNNSTNKASVASQTAPASANTSQIGTSAVNSDTISPTSALDETEMIVDQKMNVGDEGRQRDLVQENPDHHGDVDGKHQSPGVLQGAPIHSAPERRPNACITLNVVPAKRALASASSDP